MRLSLAVVVLLAAVTLSSAGRRNKFKLLLPKKCGRNWSMTWTACTDGKITRKTQVVGSQDPLCMKEELMDCIETKGYKGKNGCSKVLTMDYTPCGAGAETFTKNITMEAGCRVNKTVSKEVPCAGTKKQKWAAKRDKLAANPDKLAAKKEKRARKLKWRTYINDVKQQKDLGCFYQKNTECDPAVGFSIQQLDVTKSTADVAMCKPSLEKPCFRKNMRGGGNRKKSKKNKKNKNKRKRGGCVYRRGTWSECDPKTNMKTMRKPIKRGDPMQCNASVVVEKMCKRPPKKTPGVCKYRRTTWSECDSLTNIKTMEMTLKRGDPNTCQPTQLRERTCKRKHKALKSSCKYKKRGKWGECDISSNTISREMVLKKGDPAMCPQTKTMTKPCKNKRKAYGKNVCKYRRTTWGECDPVTNSKTMVKTLKRGDPAHCQPKVTKEKKCKRKIKTDGGCKYRSTGWSDCDLTTYRRVKKQILVRGPESCEKEKSIQGRCKRRRSMNFSPGLAQHFLGKSVTHALLNPFYSGRVLPLGICDQCGPRSDDCKYDKSQWGPCDAATNTVTRMLTLKMGDPTVCNATKVDTRKCKAKHLRPHVCKYRRTTWGECDPVTNSKTMVKTLKRGDPAHCQPKVTKEKKCKRKIKTECSYRYTNWSECDITTDRMTRKQILVSGPETCSKEKTFLKRCKKPCRFTNGDWSDCDPDTEQITRTDTLVPGGADFCPPTRVLTKSCNKGKRCQYDYGNWSECDDSAKPKRTRVQQLISGGANCQPEKVTIKPCQKPTGEERCFFGPWQDFEACQNGVQKKQREVLQGGLDCERKSVKMKAC